MQCIVTYATVRNRSYLKSVLRYKFLILETYYPDTLYLRKQGCQGAWLFFEAKGGPRAKTFGKYCPRFLVLENKTSGRLFGPDRLNFVAMTKSRRMGLMGHAA
jgi:hypothetical protein